MLRDIWMLCFGWLPAWFQVAIICIIAVWVIITIIKIIGAILNAIPFL